MPKLKLTNEELTQLLDKDYAEWSKAIDEALAKVTKSIAPVKQETKVYNDIYHRLFKRN